MNLLVLERDVIMRDAMLNEVFGRHRHLPDACAVIERFCKENGLDALLAQHIGVINRFRIQQAIRRGLYSKADVMAMIRTGSDRFVQIEILNSAYLDLEICQALIECGTAKAIRAAASRLARSRRFQNQSGNKGETGDVEAE